MQVMTSAMIQMYRQQLDSMQEMAAASLSGFERAQQCSIEMYRQAMGQQLDVLGRVNDQASQVVLDPEQARPALEGMLRAQREMVQALSDTQRRVIESFTAGTDGQQVGDVTTSYIDTMRQSIDQWQRFAQQLFQVAREQTEQMSQEAERTSRSVAGSAQRATDQTQEASRRVAEAAKQRTDQANRARATESA